MKKIFLFTSIILLVFSSNIFAQPINLSSTNFTSTTADLSWDATSCSVNVALHYRLSGTSWPGTNVNPATSPYALIGLTANTNYEWRVKCSGTSTWSSTEQFTTLGSTPGCTDATACNYDPSADLDDGSCVIPDGCTDVSACNYDPTALCDDGSCLTVFGCTDATACNYDQLATCDDGSCIGLLGCTDNGLILNGSGLINDLDGDLLAALNYNASATCDDGSCVAALNGCTDALALNFYVLANVDDGSCIYTGPTISSVSITQQILCYNDYLLDQIQVDVNQTVPPTAYVCVVGTYPITNSTYFLKFLTTDIINATQFNLEGFAPNVNYYVRLVDSLSYFNANPGGSGVSTIGLYDEYGIINFSQPNELVASTSVVLNNICPGDCIAEEELSISGGVEPYSFTLNAASPINLSPGTYSYSFLNLCEGSYDVVVTDNNGCLTSPSPTNFTIDTILPILPAGSVTLFSQSYNISCNGGSDGSIFASATGGTGIFTYSLDGINFQISTDFTGLTAGTYTVTYKDQNGCTATEVLVLNEPPVLSGSASATQDVDCFGSNTGEITFTVDPTQPGVPSYQYSIDGGVLFFTSNIFASLSGDSNYAVMIEDNNGCQFTSTVYLAEPLALASDTAHANISCNGLNDGTAEVVNISGGTPFTSGTPYTYDWIDVTTGSSIGQTSQTANFLSSGTYSCVITDGNGCTNTTDAVIIIDPSTLIVPTVHTDVNCFGGSGGTATVNASGGTPFTGLTYSYLWSNGQSNATANGLISGLYTCVITDQNGCLSTTNPIIIMDPPLLTASPTQTDVNCFGGSDGTATVNASGGTPFTGLTYSYLWSDGQITSIAIGLSSGSYSCTITDQNGCSVTSILIDVLQPSATITADVTYTNITCNGANNGQAIATPNGGTPSPSPLAPYTYDWIDQATGLSIGQTDSIATNLSEGIYICSVSDATFGCSLITNSVTIVNPTTIVIDSIIVSPVSCFGECDASIISIQASGGTPFDIGYSYLYSVNGGLSHPNSSYFNSYCANTYSVEVSDANNCFTQGIVIIDEPSLLVVDITTSLWNNYQIRCHGDNSGIANIAVNGGTTPYTMNYYVAGAQAPTPTSSPVSGLSADTYIFEVIDDHGCPYLETITYNQPDTIMHSFIPTHVTCTGWSNGSLIDSVYGGVGNSNSYTYSWNTGETSYLLTGIPIGTYTVTVTDENNCVNSSSFQINSAGALSATISGLDVSCYNYCDGEITVNAIGGIPNFNSTGNPIYNYQWNDTLFQTTQTAIGLCVNNNTNSTTYECIVTDMQGCSFSLTETITQQTQIAVTASITNEILCFNGSTGNLSSSVSGGSPFMPGGTYTYMWNNNAPIYSADPNNNGVSAGDYVITVMDAEGCTAADFITLNQPTELFLSVSDTSVTCLGFNNGIIVAIADNGTPFLGIPPEYLYTVTNVETSTTVYTETAPVGLSDNLIPGIYIIIAEDMNGCTIQSGSIYISEPGDSLSITFNTVDASCLQSNGSASIEVDGGTPSYQYYWENNITTINNPNLGAGYYTVTVIDNRGCQITDSAFVKGTYNVFADSLSEITYNICLGDSVLITINETPFNSYSWEDGSIITDRWVYPDDYINIYTLTITDPTCSSPYEVFATVNVNFIDPMIVSNPAVEYGYFPVILAGDNIDLYSDNNNCVEYTWQWTNDTISNNDGSITLDNLQETDMYYLYVKDSAGCLGYDSIYVVIGVKPYDAITPNNDGFNDSWTPLDIQSYEDALVQVFNRWGGLVFESKGGENYQAWDGTNSGKEIPVGTYYYIIDLNTGDEPQTGPVTIIR